MSSITEWTAALQDVFSTVMQRAATLVPKLVGAMLLLLLGWLVARVVRSVAVRALRLLEQAMAQPASLRGAGGLKLPPLSASILGGLLFWLVLLLFVIAAADVLGLAVFTAWLGQLVAYLPTVAAGALIIVFGLLLSRVARQLLETAAGNAAPAQRQLLGRLVQGAILVTAILVGADQIGIRVTFLVILSSVLVFALVGAAALAVSLASRSYVANLIGGHYLRQVYHIGQQVRAAGHQGKILEINATSLVLETHEGRVSLPAKVFNDAPITLLIDSAPLQQDAAQQDG
jgi:small-conductance mechanosensitive channel